MNIYRVEFWNQEREKWETSSTHRNLDYAEVNMEVLVQGGKAKARVRIGRKIIATKEA